MSDNICCCCCKWICKFLFANIVGIIFAGLQLVPNLIIGIGGTIFVSVITFFQTFLKTYYAICVSPMFGIKLRILILLTAWVPLIAYPFLSIIVATIVCALYTLIFVYRETVARISDGKSLKCDTIINVFNCVNDFFNWNCYTIPTELDRLIRYGGEVYEINVLNTLIGSFIGIIGSFIMCITFTVLAILKYVPFFFNIIFTILKNCTCDCCGIFILVAFVGFFVCIGLSPLVIPLSSITGLLCGFPIVYSYINTGNAKLSFLMIGEMIYKYDVVSTQYAFYNEGSRYYQTSSCFEFLHNLYETEMQIVNNQSHARNIPLYTEMYDDYHISNIQNTSINTQPSAPSLALQTNNPNYSSINTQQTTTLFTVQEIWEGFFEMCESSAVDAIVSNLIAIDDFESYESYLFIGLSSLVAFDGIERSRDINGIKLHSGKIVDVYSRPTDRFSINIYDTVIDIKGKYKTLNPTAHEILFIKKWLLTVGDEEKCKDYMQVIEQTRLTQIKQFTSQVQSLGTNVTRAPTFHRLFANSINKVIALKQDLVDRTIRQNDNSV